MKQKALPGVEKYTKARQWKKRWYRVMTCLACVVVFCTVYALILPAVTLGSASLNNDSAYVKSLEISKYSTGTAPFDGDDNAGNDSTAENMIVRTFDTVTYTIKVAYDVYETGNTFSEARVWLEFVLPVDSSQAEFDLADMAWMEDHQLTEDTSGGTTRQVLTGYKHLLPSGENSNVVPGDFETNVTVNIKMMKNGDTIAPTFSAAMEYNTLDGICAIHGITEKKTVTAKEITVSAAPKYNVQLKQAYATEASTTYDFSSDSSQLYDADKALNLDAGVRQGRIFVMGVTLQLYNDDPNKKMRGIELPEGEITFDIKLSSEFVPLYSKEDSTTQWGAPEDVTKDYTPLVWSYGPQELGWSLDRNTEMTSYDYAFGNAAPWNKFDASKDRDNSCYNGGTWTAVQNGSTVTFTVKDYGFDGVFPCTDAGNTAASTTYYNKESGINNIGCFSAAELYIVQPYTTESGTDVRDDFSEGGNHPQKYGTECIDGAFYMTVEDVNLQAKSISNQSLASAENSNSNQGATGDDEIKFQVDLKRNGTYEQHNLYSSRGECNIVDIFGNWGNQPGNCTMNGDDWAVIGTEFRLTFGGYAQTNGDDANKMCAAKWLLKFDPTAIELEPETATLGVEKYEYNFLYAVKPDGECWADDAELKTTSMLQLEYYESIEQAKNADKTIVGILVEAKPNTSVDDISSSILQTYFSQNAKVKEDPSLENKRFIITEESMIWTVDKYKEAIAIDGIPSLINNDPSNPTDLPDYTFYINSPSIYLNGDGVYDKHSGSYTEGDTLLVLSFKPSIVKNVEQKLTDNTTKTTYDLDADQRVIDFVLAPGVNNEISTQAVGRKTTVTIVDTLPKYLHYRSGSS
ncbi:MAG: hypothetical protein ACI4F7_09635 [Acutalibacteraceae bacterium]